MGNAPSGKTAVKKSARVAKHVNGQASMPIGAGVAAAVETASAKATRKAAPVKSATTAATAAPATPTASVSDKAKRQKKEKVVRDSFTMPKREYETIAKLKQKCLDAGIAVKKSELLRAGLLLLDALPAKRLAAAVAHVETVKTGRPSTN
ncbi:hypothetical protein LJR230_003751 [Trinickia sp. LjRoot230]|uniref:hypothetical protein n=1 Tax=Trinickia sp. LjRoot230 TaxID=3342288 RepID=UPI003ED03616